MDLHRPRLRVTSASGDVAEGPLRDGVLGGVQVTAALTPVGDDLVLDWSVANPGTTPVALRGVALAWDVPREADPVRFFANGWQSWSRSRAMVLGEDEDPSRHPDAPELARWIFLGDGDVTPAGTLRAWSVGVLGAGDPLLCIGFEGGAAHDGVVTVRAAGDVVEVAAEAVLGGAVLAPGASRALHRVRIARGDDAGGMLASWAGRAGLAGGARAHAPFTTGWCSWYRWFGDVTERIFLDDLAASADWPFDVFQLDDGWQPAIGDWLVTNAKFPAGLAGVAARVAGSGRKPGLWLAPFLVAPDSAVARTHPEWLARLADGDAPLPGGFNPAWGGLVHALDVTRPEVLAHLEHVARTLVAQGFGFLKLDFVYAAACPGRFADPTRTPAERVRAGLDAIRRGAGEATFLLGCGAPLAPSVGVVDGMRIGPDVAPHWAPQGLVPGFDEETPAVANAWRSTLTRAPLHRRLWLNDPDCVMLRRHATALSPEAAEAWAQAVGTSGGLVMLSDDMPGLDAAARRTFEDVVALGRRADAASRAGHTARCPDLLTTRLPRRFSGTTGAVAFAGDR